MKKLLLLAFIALCTGIIIPQKLYAVDISVGASTWYVWWDRDEVDIDPAFLYGPVLAAKFTDNFNMTFVYLHGRFDAKDTANTFTMKRNDSDIALNFRLNNYFKLFAGMKYMSYSGIGNNTSYGPGLGISATFPILENLFLLANISIIYLWGDNDGGDFKEQGTNSSLSLAYYIASASTVISLGGRYQEFTTVYDDNNKSRIKHEFYGVTLTATYTFSI